MKNTYNGPCMELKNRYERISYRRSRNRVTTHIIFSYGKHLQTNGVFKIKIKK